MVPCRVTLSDDIAGESPLNEITEAFSRRRRTEAEWALQGKETDLTFFKGHSAVVLLKEDRACPGDDELQAVLKTSGLAADVEGRSRENE